MLFIFDLDHTTIDASHRGAFDSNGNGDLSEWIKLATPENIAKDKLLPLGEQWWKLLRKGATIIICTSRVMGDADFKMLRDHGLGWHYMLSRDSDEPAHTMKHRLLSSLGWSELCRNAVMFDDDENVIYYLRSKGLNVKDAKLINPWLQVAQ